MANENILNVIEEAISQYRPSGAFAKARAEQLATKQATAIPQMYSGLIKAGLGGTTVTQTIPTKFEQEIARPFQTETELLRSQRLMESILAKAGIMESAEQRTFEANLATQERNLREKLAREEITSNEYIAEMGRISNERIAAIRAGGGGGGGGSSGLFSQSLFHDTPSGATPGKEDTGGYGYQYAGGYSGPEWDPSAAVRAPISIYEAGGPPRTISTGQEQQGYKLYGLGDIRGPGASNYSGLIGGVYQAGMGNTGYNQTIDKYAELAQQWMGEGF